MKGKVLLTCFSLAITANIYSQMPNTHTWDTVIIDAPVLITKGARVISYDFYTNDSTESILSASVELNSNKSAYTKLAGPYFAKSTNRFYCHDSLTVICKYSYNYTLQFHQEGVFQLPPMHVKTSSMKVVESGPFQIRVTNDSIDLHNRKILTTIPSVNKTTHSIGDTIQYEIQLVYNIGKTVQLLKTEQTGDSLKWNWNCLHEKNFTQNILYEGIPAWSTKVMQAEIVPTQKGNYRIAPIITLHFPALKVKSVFDDFFSNYMDTVIQATPVEIVVN